MKPIVITEKSIADLVSVNAEIKELQKQADAITPVYEQKREARKAFVEDLLKQFADRIKSSVSVKSELRVLEISRGYIFRLSSASQDENKSSYEFEIKFADETSRHRTHPNGSFIQQGDFIDISCASYGADACNNPAKLDMFVVTGYIAEQTARKGAIFIDLQQGFIKSINMDREVLELASQIYSINDKIHTIKQGILSSRIEKEIRQNSVFVIPNNAKSIAGSVIIVIENILKTTYYSNEYTLRVPDESKLNENFIRHQNETRRRKISELASDLAFDILKYNKVVIVSDKDILLKDGNHTTLGDTERLNAIIQEEKKELA